MQLDSLPLASTSRRALGQATRAYAANVAQAKDFLLGRGISGAMAGEAHLGYVYEPQPGHERFRGMLAIPYITASGPIAIRFRCLCGGDCKALGHEKYDSPAGQPTRLYNSGVVATTHATTALICEGELDAVVAQGLFGLPALAAPGTQWKEHWSRCFADFERVIIVADNDRRDDGSNPGLKHAKNVRELIPMSEIAEPPLGMDLTEWIQSAGVETVRTELDL